MPTLDLTLPSGRLSCKGESVFADTLRALVCAGRRGRDGRVTVTCELRAAEPDAFQTHPLAVYIAGRQVAFVQRKATKGAHTHLSRLTAAGVTVTCRGDLSGGESGRPHIGVFLHTDWATLQARLKAAKA